MIRALVLLLTTRCNLECAYCFESLKNGQSMHWNTLRAALDVGLEHGGSTTKVLFTGGEPLLEYGLIRRAVSYLRKNRRNSRHFRFTLLTNGTLMDEQKLEFLSANSCRVQLSFDGVRPAQNLRGRGTFSQLDRLLRVMPQQYPDFFRTRLSVSMTVTPRTVRHLADSVEYFLSRGVRTITMAPTLADSSGWKQSRVGELDIQFSRILRASLSHLCKTGRVPLTLFKGWEDPGNPPGGRGTLNAAGNAPMCRAPSGRTLAVDPDGTVSACATLSTSYQRFRSELLRSHARLMRMGNVRSADFIEQRAGFADRARQSQMFYGKLRKHSSYRSCSECDCLAECSLCPVAIGHIPGNKDPDRVPDFYCAFNFTSLIHRREFMSRALFDEPAAVGVGR